MLSKITSCLSKYVTFEKVDKGVRGYNAFVATAVATNFVYSVCKGIFVDPVEHLFDVAVHTFQAFTSMKSKGGQLAIAAGLNIGRMVAIYFHLKNKDSTINPPILNPIDFGNHILNMTALIYALHLIRKNLPKDKPA